MGLPRLRQPAILFPNDQRHPAIQLACTIVQTVRGMLGWVDALTQPAGPCAAGAKHRVAQRSRPAAYRLSRTVCGDIVESSAERGLAVCNLFVSQDPATYAAETRSVRLHGHVTSIRLETAFWTTLEEIASHEGLSVARFVSVLHDEILDRTGEVANFASFLRVACLHWVRNQTLHAAQIAERDSSVGPHLAAEKLRATA